MNGLVKAAGLLLASLLVAMLNCGGEGTPTIIVDSTADTDSRDGVVTLREAILLASGELAVADLDSEETDNVGQWPGAQSSDRILFDSSTFTVPDGGIISLNAPLPTLSAGSDTIDGSRAGVIVDGGNQTFHCLTIDSSQNVIKGLHIQNCLVGVKIEPGAKGNVIGTGNVISGNDEGILIGDASSDAGADSNVVKGNLIGVDASGSEPLGNRNGVHIHAEARANVIGGSDPGDRNIISGNRGVGITIRGSANIVQGNYIGTDASGTVAIPNGMEGIWIAPGGRDNIIGGSSAQERNVISGNDLFGLSISGVGATGNVVKGNYIGVDASGSAALANRYGLVISNGPQNNLIGGFRPGEGNVISGNSFFGVHVDGATTVGNSIRGNSIHSNGQQGIHTEDGGNGDLEPPVVTGVSPVTGTACPNCTVDIYSDSGDEGAVHEGSTVAEGDGGFTFEGSPSGPNITATTTDAEGNTSAFSRPLIAAVQ